MRDVIVQDQMNVQVIRYLLIDVTQEADELHRSVTALELADDVAGGDIQGCKRGRRAIAPIVVCMRLGHAVGVRPRFPGKPYD